MTTLGLVLLILWTPVWLYTLFVVAVQPLVWIFRDRRRRRQLPLMTTPLGRVRVGLDSPELIERYRAW